MLYVFKNIWNSYVCVGMVGSVSLFLWQYFVCDNFLTGIILSLLWVMICSVIFTIISIKRYGKAVEKLYNCRIREFVDEHEELLKRKSNYRRELTVLNSWLATGYYYLGDFKKAEDILWELKGKNITDRWNYFSLLYLISIGKGDVQKAEEVLDDMKKIVSESAVLKKRELEYKEMIKTRECRLNMEKGNFEGARELFEGEFEKGTNLLSKCVAKFNLAKIYIHEGDVEKAKEALTFVVENGKDAAMVKAAREMM